jgi:hypothetical protein
VSDTGLEHLAQLPALASLDVSDCSSSAARIRAPGSGFQRPGLAQRPAREQGHEGSARGAKLLHVGGVTDCGVAYLLERRAEAAGLAASTEGVAAGAGAGQAAAQGLRSLALRGTGVTDAALAHLRGLTSLELQGCGRVTSSGLAHALASCPQLQRLHLSGTQVRGRQAGVPAAMHGCVRASVRA